MFRSRAGCIESRWISTCAGDVEVDDHWEVYADERIFGAEPVVCRLDRHPRLRDEAPGNPDSRKFRVIHLPRCSSGRRSYLIRSR